VVTAPVVTWTLVGINVLLYLAVLARPSIAGNLAMVGRIGNGPGAIGVGAGQWYRLITSAFVAPTGGFGITDIAFNMLALIVVGPPLERMLGSTRYLAVYLLSALGGAVFLYYLVPLDEVALGASGAVFGLFGAWFVVSRRRGFNSRGILGLIVINGTVITAAYAYAPRSRRYLIQGAATVAVLAVLILAVAVRNGQIGVAGF